MSIKALQELIQKTGSISAASVSLSGQLLPQEAKNFINLIFDRSDFMKLVTTDTMTRLNKRIQALDLATDVLVRVPEGTGPTEAQRTQFSVLGCELMAKPAQLFARILQETLVDNKDNPNFESEMVSKFATIYGNALVSLGFKGAADDYANSLFSELNVGWLEIIRGHAQSQKPVYDATPGALSYGKRLQMLIDTVDEDAHANSSIVLNPKDHARLRRELGEDNRSVTLQTGNTLPEYEGFKLVVRPEMPEGSYLATPLKNLVFGMCTDISRSREWKGEERCISYTYDSYFDYGVVVGRWASLLEPETP